MGVYVTNSGRGWWRAALIGAALTLALLVAMLILLPLAGLVMLAGLLLSGLALVAQRLSARPAARPARRTGASWEADTPAAAITVEGLYGEPLLARPVSLPGPSAHTFALTREGYVLLDEAGRVIHRLR